MLVGGEWLDYNGVSEGAGPVGIVSFSFEDRRQGWRLEKVEFDDVTLLVGASGVGKTRILTALRLVKAVALGKCDAASFPKDCTWELEVDSEPDGQRVLWSVETGQPRLAYIESETISVGGEVVLARARFPEMMQAAASLITLFGGSPPLSVVRTALSGIVDTVAVTAGGRALMWETELDQLADAHGRWRPAGSEQQMPVWLLGYRLQERHPSVFSGLIGQFRGVFPSVEDVQVRMASGTNGQDWLEVFVKERGVRDWLDPSQLSAGMSRTLHHIMELAVAPAGSTILVDEFETSLGINCLGPVTDLIMDRSDEVQFILTSHHPYIINNIPMENWRVVTRHGSTVRALRADDIPALKGESAFDDFFRLLNAAEYRGGVS